MQLTDKVAIVTGAARGIGFDIASKLSEEGATVLLIDKEESELSKAVQLLTNLKRNVQSYVLDVTDDFAVMSFLDQLRELNIKVDILINNAGISPKVDGVRRETHTIPINEWEQVLKVNLTAPFLFTKGVLPIMMEKGWGRIINISSVAGRQASKIAGSHYAATKSALIGFSRTVASEYGKYGITVNNVAPGRIESKMAEMATEQVAENFLRQVPLGKSGTPQDVSAAVLFLCSEGANYITGATIDVNGGIYMN
ncbi:SDR family NAD(P)-dependent oxidoreductase [Ureibacillus composti]|nr:SDR family NAD(P)-dependent oxidoreductase [Ureibacillus composti]